MEAAEPCTCGPEPCRACGNTEGTLTPMALCPECSKSTGVVSFDFSEDEALVLFELVARFSESEALTIEHKAEEVLLWGIDGSLESILLAPFLPDYKRLLRAAREAVLGEH